MGFGSMIYLCSTGKKEDILKIQQYLYEQWFICRLIHEDEGIGPIDAEIITEELHYEYFDKKEDSESLDYNNPKDGVIKADTPCLMIYGTWRAHNAIHKCLGYYETINNLKKRN